MNKDVAENLKKVYARPEMKIVELKRRSALLQSSDPLSVDLILEED